MKVFAFKFDRNYDRRASMLNMIDDHIEIPDKERYICYLKDPTNGMAGYMGEFQCLINPGHVQYSEAYNTDGVWVWTTQMIHYIEHHHLIIPEEFRQHIESNNFTMPVLTEEELDAIGDEHQYFFSHSLSWVPPDGYDTSL